MKKITFAFALFFIILSLTAQKVNLRYYIPGNERYNTNIPTPQEVIGHEVGEWHVTHDKLVQYMKALAAASDQSLLEVLECW